MVLEEGEDWGDGRGGDVNREFVFPYGELLDVFRKTREEVAAVGVKGFGLREVLVGWVDDWCMEGTDLCVGGLACMST